MKMTLEKFHQLIKADADKKAKVQTEIADLVKQEAALNAEIRAAAENDDLATFRAKKKALEEVTEALQVKRLFSEKTTVSVTEADARDIWADYTGKYNKDMAKAQADFASLREKLVAAYLNMVNLQNDACRTREYLCDALDISYPDRALPMQYIPLRGGSSALGLIKKGNLVIQDPDFVYVSACMEIKAGRSLLLDPSTAEAQEMEKAYSVVNNHRSK